MIYLRLHVLEKLRRRIMFMLGLVYVVPTINTVILSARSVYPFKQPFQEIKVCFFYQITLKLFVKFVYEIEGKASLFNQDFLKSTPPF